MSLTFTDIFCGAGGSSIGLDAAGMELKLAANHWERAIETHSANFRDAEHLCADVNNYDMRRLPTTDILWASPICTEISPAGGRARRNRPAPGQGDLFETDPVPSAAFDRTRATAYDVIRATEVHRYTAVLVENVVEFATDWELFDWWLSGMVQLGYNHQIVCVSSAHIGGDLIPYAPQWRDRLYIVFTRTGIRLPDLAPRPLAWCPTCAQTVHGVQWWKNTKRRLGKYRQQYLYRCPNTQCRNEVVEPFVSPAAAAIDWSDLGTRVGDRARPLAPKTVERIRAGLAMFARHTMVSVPADTAPLPSRTKRIGDGIASPPMLVPSGGTWNEAPYAADGPLRTRLANEKGYETLVVPPGAFLAMLRRNGGAVDVCAEAMPGLAASGLHHGLAVPPFIAAAAGHTYERPGSGYYRVLPADEAPLTARTKTGADALVIPDEAFLSALRSARPRNSSVGQPTPTVLAQGGNMALVIPYRRGNTATTTDEPLHALTARESAALVEPAVAVEDCLFRMLKPREHLRAQAFPDSYVVHGNKGEQTMQAGNAVSANVAQWLGERVYAALAGRPS